MNDERWKPHVTVATLVENQGKFLLVKEHIAGRLVYNQPAGHLEADESLIAAAERETLEETGWQVEVSGYLGVYRFIAPSGTTYLRHGFVAKPIAHDPQRPLDTGIVEAPWLSYEQILSEKQAMRSPMVIQLIQDYLHKSIYPLALFHEDR